LRRTFGLTVLDTKIKENLPHKWVIQVMDFAKNRGVSYQEEAKAAFFSNSQITMHPIVNYYRKRDNPGIAINPLPFVPSKLFIIWNFLVYIFSSFKIIAAFFASKHLCCTASQICTSANQFP
jgi:hypothetical protein